jgi:hypothetical protein
LSRTDRTASSPSAIRQVDLALLVVLHRVERVSQQVDDHLFQPQPVGQDHHRTARQVLGDLHPHRAQAAAP